MNPHLDTSAEAMEAEPQRSLRAAARSSLGSLRVAWNSRSLSKLLSDEGLTKKASLNAFAALLDYGAQLSVGFIINPLLVAGLGTYAYGVWEILRRLIGQISPATGRPGQALKFFTANQQASTDYEKKRRAVGSAVAVWALFVPILAGLGGFLTWYAPAWIKTSEELSLSVRLATALLVADLIMSSLADLPRSVLQGENLGYKRMGLSTLLVFIGGGFIVLAMFFKSGLVGVAMAQLATTLLTGALFLQIVRSYAPWFGIARPALAEVRRFFNLSGWFLAWRLVNQLIVASDVLLLGRLHSVEIVTTYTLTKYVSETVISLIAIVVAGIAPGLGGIIGTGNFKKAAHVRSETIAGTWLIATVVGTTILAWNGPFLRLWVGDKFYAGPIPSLLITLMVTQFVLIRNDANFIDLTLELRSKVLLGILSVAISLVCAGVLVGYFHLGINGLCLGLMAGRSILSLSYPLIVGRCLKITLYSQLKGVLRPAGVTILFFVLALNAGKFLTASGWIDLILSVGMTTGVVSLPVFFIGLSGSQRGLLLKRVQNVTGLVKRD